MMHKIQDSRFSNSEEDFLSEELEGDQNPKDRPPRGLYEEHEVGPHVGYSPVEREHVVAQGMSNVQDDWVHPRLYERRSVPYFDDVNKDVTDGQEDECKRTRH